MADINIGGKLHSVATGNVVADASEVLDSTEGKKQSVVNSELRQQLAGKASTSAIPTKTSQLQNDSNFLTQHQQLKTINNESIVGSGNIQIEGGSDVPEDIALLEDYGGESVLPDFNPRQNCLRVDSRQALTQQQQVYAKRNVLNKDNNNEISIRYIEPHIVNNENVLAQEDFGDAESVYDTLFIISHDFYVQGTAQNPVKVPNNCKLLFMGGNLIGGYLDLNGAEIYPSYNSLVENSLNTPPLIIGSPASGTIYINKTGNSSTRNKITFWDGSQWVYANGVPVTLSFVREGMPTIDQYPDLPMGYMYYDTQDQKVCVLTGVSGGQYQWRAIATEAI